MVLKIESPKQRVQLSPDPTGIPQRRDARDILQQVMFAELGAAGGGQFKLDQYFKPRDDIYVPWCQHAVTLFKPGIIPEATNTYTVAFPNDHTRQNLTIVGMRFRHYDTDIMGRPLGVDPSSTPMSQRTPPTVPHRRVDATIQVGLNSQGDIVGIYERFFVYEPEHNRARVIMSRIATDPNAGIKGLATAMEAAAIHQGRQIATEQDTPGIY